MRIFRTLIADVLQEAGAWIALWRELQSSGAALSLILCFSSRIWNSGESCSFIVALV